MEKRSALYALLVFGSLLALCFVFLYFLFSALEQKGEQGWGSGLGPRIGVVELSGTIMDSKDVVGQLHELRKDNSIKAIVLRIDSPGGAVAPSQEIYRAVLRAKKDKKIVCSMGTLAASGGYYVAAACDKIYASPGTITGSIGVISEFPHVQGLMALARVEVDTIKSGPMKDSGTPLRGMTESEKKFFQAFVDGVYEQFLDDVSAGRKIPKETLRPLADGRILTGKEALAHKLIDELGNLEDAIDGAAVLAGQKGEAVPVFEPKKRGSWVGDLLRGATQGAIEAAQPRGSIEVRDPRL
ncbi:MAG: signal peptide peptidase SppA, type [Myxococcales bacterium]|nr:signal peptide peptidase SppA, type [Myxococcales bacterium]